MASVQIDRKKRRRTRTVLGLGVIAGGLLTIILLGRIHPGLLGASLMPVFIVITLLLAQRWMIAEGGVPILVYHSTSDRPDWLPWAAQLSVSTATFRRHLETIRAGKFHVLRTLDLVAARRAGRPVPPRSVVIHLDDGYLDNWVAAFPLLRQAGIPATIFVSLDFIEEGDSPRPNLDDVWAGRCKESDLCWQGYLNWAELRAMQASGLIDVQPHGIDHGRVETGPSMVDEVRPENWRQLAWVQWRAMPGNKTAWYRHKTPPAAPYGTPVRQNDGALKAPAWTPDGQETQQQYENRVRTVLVRSRATIEEKLGDVASIFCWPQNLTNDRAREIAAAVGYQATTGGRGENRPEEDPAVLSRVHVSDCALGWRWNWAEGIALHATVRLFQGNYYWYLALLAMHGSRRIAIGLNRSVGRRIQSALNSISHLGNRMRSSA